MLDLTVVASPHSDHDPGGMCRRMNPEHQSLTDVRHVTVSSCLEMRVVRENGIFSDPFLRVLTC